MAVQIVSLFVAIARVLHAIETNVPVNPIKVGMLGFDAVVFRPDRVPDAFQEG